MAERGDRLLAWRMSTSDHSETSTGWALWNEKVNWNLADPVEVAFLSTLATRQSTTPFTVHETPCESHEADTLPGRTE
jgi:hypothetical protein